MHPGDGAQLGSASGKPKPAPAAIQPSDRLTVIEPSLPTLSPDGTPSGNPEDTATPQLPAIAVTNIQAAQQRREAAPNSDNAAPQARLKSLNGVVNSAKAITNGHDR